MFPRAFLWSLSVKRAVLQFLFNGLRGRLPGRKGAKGDKGRECGKGATPWRWLGLAALLLGALPAHAIDYVFPGNLPLGCVDHSSGNYSCGALTLAASDTLVVAAPKPVTITFSDAVSAGASVQLNAGGAASDLTLIVNGSFVLGDNATLNGTVTAIGAGDVTVGAGSAVVGNISTQTGYVTVDANSTLGGSISTVSGYVTLGAGTNVTGAISTQDQGYVVLGAGARVGGAIAISGGGYVTTGDSASVGGSISTRNGGVTLGANGYTGGSIVIGDVGAVTVGAGAYVVGNITTQNGATTVGANARVDGQIAANGTGDITLGAGSVAYAVCCNSANASCLVDNSGKSAPRICIDAASTNFDCLETGAAYNNVVGNPGLRNPLFTKLAGTPFTFDVVAIKLDGTRATNYASGSSSKTIKVELVDGSGTTACASRAAEVPAVSQMLTLVGTDGGVKTVSVMVDRTNPELRCRVTDANVSPAIVRCSSDSFSVRPAALALVASAATAPSAKALPAIAAGASFSLGAATQSGSGYGGTLVLDTSKLSAQLPAQDTTVQGGGVVGVLTPIQLIANAASINASYNEAGYLYLAPGAFRDDGYTLVDSTNGDCITSTVNDNYLADTLINGKYGCSVGNRVATTLGRFTPDHFDVGLPALTAACAVGTPFSYFGQDGFTTAFTLTARNSAGSTTQNYSGAFARFDPTVYANYGFSASALPAGSVLTGSATAPSSSWGQGVARVSARHQIGRPNAPAPETLVTISALPSDGEARASAIGVVGDSVRLRFGRLQMKNAYGSEMLPLPVPLEAQYWAGGGYYLTNTDDSCSVIPMAAIVMGNYQKQLAACQTTLSSTGGVTLQSGKLPVPGLQLSRPGAGHAGSVDLQLNVTAAAYGNTCVSSAASPALAGQLPWFGNNPQARATFGIYKSRLVYSRENY